MEKIITKKPKILITGANGFVGFNFVSKIKPINKFELYEFCSFSTDKDLKRFCKDCDYVFHFAGVIKSNNEKDFVEGNVNLTKKILSYLKHAKNKAPIVFSSSIWIDHTPEHIYSKTKLEAENLLKSYSKKQNVPVYIYRLNNLYGPNAEPYYGGVTATFAYNVIHNIPLTINDPNKELTLTYVDDLIDDFLNLLNNKKHVDGFYCELPKSSTSTIGNLASLMKNFNDKKFNVSNLKTTFEKNLYSVYSYYYDNLNNKDFKKITIIFNTCEKYHDTWIPFFTLFKKYGEGLTNCNIIFNSERTVYDDKELNITSTASFKDMTGKPWGERLKFALSLAKTDYVFFVMEDYYLQKHVNGLEILKCLNYMEKNKNIGMFNFESLANIENESVEYPNYCMIPISTPYRLNAQASIWRRDILDKSILPEESPWDWEIYGNQRNNVILKDVEIYCLKYGSKEPYYTNYYEKRTDWKGYHINRNGVMKGKWYVSFIDPLFKANNIEVNYSNLGVYKPKYYKFSWWWNFLGSATRKIRKCKLFNRKEYEVKKQKYENLVKKYIENDLSK